jgi:hypothetical protein
MPHENQRRGELEHPEKVLGVTFMPNDQTPEVLQPGKQPLDFPPSSVSLQPTSILSRTPSVPTMWSNDLDAVEPQFCVEAVEVVGVVTDQVLRGVGNTVSVPRPNLTSIFPQTNAAFLCIFTAEPDPPPALSKGEPASICGEHSCIWE